MSLLHHVYTKFRLAPLVSLKTTAGALHLHQPCILGSLGDLWWKPTHLVDQWMVLGKVSASSNLGKSPLAIPLSHSSGILTPARPCSQLRNNPLVIGQVLWKVGVFHSCVTLWQTNITIENGPLTVPLWVYHLLTMLIFHSYVSLPPLKDGAFAMLVCQRVDDQRLPCLLHTHLQRS